VTTKQTSVSGTMTVAFPGMLADSTYVKQGTTRNNREASAEIPFGVAVVRHGTAEADGALLPHTSAAASAPIFAGITYHTHFHEPVTELGDVGMKPGVEMDVLEIGHVWVLPEESVTPGDAVRFRAVATGGEQAGRFRTSADTTDCVNVSSCCRWLTAGGPSTPAKLEINLIAGAGVADT
jgi:hypothetical protein